MACARSACGRGCGKRLEPEMASPRPVGSQLRYRKARNGAVSRRVNERRGCVVVIAITLHPCWGLRLTPIVPAHHCLPVEPRLRRFASQIEAPIRNVSRRPYQGVRQVPLAAGDDWRSLDDGDEYDDMCR